MIVIVKPAGSLDHVPPILLRTADTRDKVKERQLFCQTFDLTGALWTSKIDDRVQLVTIRREDGMYGPAHPVELLQ